MFLTIRLSWSRIMFLIALSAITLTTQAQEKTAAGLYNEGLALLKSKNYEEGLALMEQALVKAEAKGDEKIIGLGKKNGAVAAYNVGNAKRKAGALDEAMAFYQKAISLNPSYSSSYEGVARVLEKQGKVQEAVTSYLKSAKMALDAGKTKSSASRYKKVRIMIGKKYVAKEYDDAIAAGQAFIAQNDTDADVFYYMAQSYGKKNDFEAGVEHITKAIELAGENTPDKYLYAQGSMLEKLGKKSEAVAAYQKITEEKYKAQADYRIGELKGR